VTLHDVGPGKPFPFDARLVNPKPVGDIHSSGHFGPWQSEQPRDTPVDGNYSFTNADLGTIKGISGKLTSTGAYGGTLGEIGVTGTTDTPDFALDVSEHPVDLRTVFNATVDGTTGDTKLNSVHATLLRTVLDVNGMVMRASDMPGAVPSQSVPGHFIDLSVASSRARVEDILRLGAKTSPPLMRGDLALRAHLTIPPGDVSVSKKMRVQGTFAIHEATLANQRWQDTVDNLSLRAQGHPKELQSEVAPVVVADRRELYPGERDAGYAEAQLPDARSTGGACGQVQPGRQYVRLRRNGADQGDGVADADGLEEHCGDAVRQAAGEEWRGRGGSGDDQRDQVGPEVWRGRGQAVVGDLLGPRQAGSAEASACGSASDFGSAGRTSVGGTRRPARTGGCILLCISRIGGGAFRLVPAGFS
jgi:hypothetical protein